MKRHGSIFPCLFLASALSAAPLSPGWLANPPPEDPVPEDCECRCGCCETVSDGCTMVKADLGGSTPESGSVPLSLEIRFDAEAWDVFRRDRLLMAYDGFGFSRLGQGRKQDGATPSEVFIARPDGSLAKFRFAEDAAAARPAPGLRGGMAERLAMTDADGAATTANPAHYELYMGDGTMRRFDATPDACGNYGALESVRTAQGRVATPFGMGVDVVRDFSGVRQVLAPSRLADVSPLSGADGFVVAVHAVQSPPERDSATGLYAVPQGEAALRIVVAREDGGRRVSVTVRKGGGDARTHVFECMGGCWSLRRASGVSVARRRVVEDERAAQIVRSTRSPSGALLARRVKNYAWMPWDAFAMTNRVDGFDGMTETTVWTYYTSGGSKGLVHAERRQSGLQISYSYDPEGRVVSETRSGPGMMTETATYSYAPLAEEDVPRGAVDARPRTVVKTVGGVEAERTYFLYAELSNVVERAASPGAAYGAAGALRTVTEFFPLMTTWAGGRVRRIRREDGRVDEYGYSMEGDVWTEKATHLHESADAPVEGRTTRDFTLTNERGETVETRTEAYVGGEWRVVARELRTHDAQGRVVRREDLAGQATTTEWDCCHKISETDPDGSTTTWEYDEDDRMVASSRLAPLDMTEVAWLTTCHEYDGLGRETATWRTNTTANVGLPVTRTDYDQLGHAARRIDSLGNITSTEYSSDGRTVTVRNPNFSTRVVTRNADGDTLSVTGTAATPEFHVYGTANLEIASQTVPCRVHTVREGSEDSARFTTTYENMLGQTVREERSGFRGALLATVYEYDSCGRLVRVIADHEPTVEYTYDSLGERISTTRTAGRAAPGAPQGGPASVPAETEWRRSAVDVRYVMLDGQVWLAQTNTVSCSDASIAPLVTSTARQLTGLTAANPSRAVATDERGNATETWTAVNGSIVTRHRRVPYATNVAETTLRYGDVVREVSVSGVTDTYAYDALGRQISHTDGRGNTSRTEYNALGLRSASIDALGNRTAYAYDRYGNLSAVTNPLGNAVVYEYDLRGRKTYEGGATYPVRYTYDVFGNRTTMTTYRNESLGPSSGDVTTWRYDEASNCMTNKVYADGKGPRYGYTQDGKLSQRIWARGIVTDYAYDGWGSLTNTVYSDATPTVTLSYDTLGRQTNAVDAAGVTSFAYDDYGSLTNETVVGAAGENTIIRHWDSFGRTAGYSLVGRAAPSAPQRQTTIGYDPATGRIATMLANGSNVPFTWSYLPGSDLKSSLAYPNGLTASWTYDANDQLLQIRNATPTDVISQYDYMYDAARRRINVSKAGTAFDQVDTVAYCYNSRSELTNAVAAVDSAYRYAYDFDEIGNRETSIERGTNAVYTANNLDQYTAVDDFTPQFDDDGNQTLVKTATGIWSVTYNGENRPIYWKNGDTDITMSYDRMGRRNTKNGLCFVYKGYLQIANFGHSASNVEPQVFVWDPMEPVATRPLTWSISTTQLVNSSTFYYVYDGNKNVSEAIKIDGDIAAHYEYAPFGSVVAQCGVSAPLNPWRFSCEYADDEAAMVYYNFRHYNPSDGRWFGRDKIGHVGGKNLQAYCVNRPTSLCDMLGLYSSVGIETHQNILKHALDALIEEGGAPCLKDAGKREHVLDALQAANAGMDRGLYAEDEKLYFHFNRKMDQSPQGAIVAYTNALAEWRTGIDTALKAGWSEDCRKALRLMGELTHMTQDYWGHGVSWGYELHPRLVMTGDPVNPVIYDPGYPPDSEIGEATGSPDDPSMKPSSYAGPLGDSEHGPIYGREPGNRAPDGTGWKLPFFWDYSTGRLGKAVDYTKQDLRKYLGTWCEKCCRFLEAQPAPYYGPRPTRGEFFSAIDY